MVRPHQQSVAVSPFPPTGDNLEEEPSRNASVRGAEEEVSEDAQVLGVFCSGRDEGRIKHN